MHNNRSKETALTYLTGFGNELISEAIPGAVPQGQNNPQICPMGLYAEQLSGTAFTVPRSEQKRSWMYRIVPSVRSSEKKPVKKDALSLVVSDFTDCLVEPNQLRWKPFEYEDPATKLVDFVDGMTTICGSGSASTKTGFGIHSYCANSDMQNTSLVNADGDYLIVPQDGGLLLTTEFGRLTVEPHEICVIPRGMQFSVALLRCPSRGFILEVYEGHFRLPDLGPIGANGLANPRDFEHPVAWFEDRVCHFKVLWKLHGSFFESYQSHSPFDVVGWHGNYLPYKYDLRRFSPVNSVAFDHSDPSIFTVLTVPSSVQGVAVADFVIFPPRWMVAEHTFRPPYFHRNCMNEFMGCISGSYDAKKGFYPGCSSLHVCMTPHGPDKDSYLANIDSETDIPVRSSDASLSFMFETSGIPKVTPFALGTRFLDKEYRNCWQGFKRGVGLDGQNA